MKFTLLELTQLILASMDSDEINDISDTSEAQSVVGIIKTTYFDLASRANLPRHSNVFQLVGSADLTRPVTMTLPSNVASLEWIKYNSTATAPLTTTLHNPGALTTSSALTAIDETAIIPNRTTVTKIGMYQTVAKTVTLKIAKKNSAGNYDIVVNKSFAHPGGGWADCVLSSPYTIPSIGSYYIGAWSSGISDEVTSPVPGAYVLTTDVTGISQAFTEDPAGGTWPLRYTSMATGTSALRTITPLTLPDFLDQVMSLNTTNSTTQAYVETLNGSQFTLLCQNNSTPHYYTTTNDGTVLFDRYDNTVDSTLQPSKTMCWGLLDFPWFNTNAFVPDLDDRQHQLLLNEAKSLAFAELKQTPHPKAEKNARRLWIDGQSDKTKIPLLTAHQRDPNYGRK